MLKTKKTALIALAVGAVMLTTAAVANFATSNGYNIYKESVRKLFDQDNYTAGFSVAIFVDDEEIVKTGAFEQYDKASGNYVQKEYTNDSTAKIPNKTQEVYYQDGQKITFYSHEYNNGKFVENNKYNINDFYASSAPTPVLSKYNFINSREDEEMFDKYYNFASAMADLFVGDIKNNFVITSAQDGLATYEANLDLFQIPEIVNAGTDLIVSQLKHDMDCRDESDSSSDDFEDYVTKFEVDPFVSGAKCTFTADDEGRLINNVLTGEISGKDSSGEAHTMKVVIEISCGDYGTTIPEKVDIDNVEHVTQSQLEKERLAELEILLDGKLSEADRKNYEHEYNNLKARIDYFEENGMIDYDDISFEENKDGEIKVVYHTNGIAETEEVIVSEGVEILD